MTEPSVEDELNVHQAAKILGKEGLWLLDNFDRMGIPHQGSGKRMTFRHSGLQSWLGWIAGGQR